MNRFFESLINLFFPPKCPFCGKVLDAVGICPMCEKDLPWLPEEQVVMTDKDLTCAAPLWYEGAVREALLRLKFRGGSALAEPFGELLARCAAERFGGEFDTVTWVPVSQKRFLLPLCDFCLGISVSSDFFRDSMRSRPKNGIACYFFAGPKIMMRLRPF